MSKQDGDPGALENIPDIDGIVIVPSKKQATTEGEVHTRGAKYDALLGVDGDLSICPQVIEATRGIIRPRSKSIPTGVVPAESW